jgi:tetratricopeptide (TPR) repeat protein
MSRPRLVILAVAAMLLLALEHTVLMPLRREHAKARARQRLERAIRTNNPVVITRMARATLADLDGYRFPFSTDAETQIDRAAAYMLLENYPAAIREYQQALRLDKRPEIYLNLGEALMATGQAEAAVQALTRAVLFDRVLLNQISDGLSRQRVETQLAAIQGAGGPCEGAVLRFDPVSARP